MKHPNPQVLPSGLLVIYKSLGMTSKDVSRRIERAFGRQKIGHIGTLDPMAEGVLPLLLGRATRLQDLLLGMEKEYLFEVRWGVETDSLDAEGQVVRTAPLPLVDEAEVVHRIRVFVGEIEQEPPAYSAIKFKGQPLYRYAREGDMDAVPLAEMRRQVKILSLELLSYDQQFGRFRVRCSKGTYVRSLARDIAEKLGTCGTVTKLERTLSSGCHAAGAHQLEDVEKSFAKASSLIVPIEDIHLNIPKWQDGANAVMHKLWNGQKLFLDAKVFAGGLVSAGVTGSNHANLLFLNPKNEAVGIGASHEDFSGRVQLSLKRGLI